MTANCESTRRGGIEQGALKAHGASTLHHDASTPLQHRRGGTTHIAEFDKVRRPLDLLPV